MKRNSFKNRIYDKIKAMILWITKRRVVSEIYKTIWRGNNPDYKIRGFPLQEIDSVFFGRHIVEDKGFQRFVFPMVRLINKNYIRDFAPKIEDIIKDCIEEKYIENKNGLLRIAPKGKNLISIWHNISETLKHPFILEIVKYGLGLGIPAYTIYKVIGLFK